jgi:hypothetical protein
MRITLSLAVASSIVAATAILKAQTIMAQETAVSSPVRCLLPDPDLRERRAEIVATLGGTVEAVEELPDGYRLRFRADQAEVLMEFVRIERACCPFMRYTLEFEPENGPLWFSLTGPEGTKDFLKPLLESIDAPEKE